MGFGGWPAEALEFFEGLEADNSKAYWTANKATYEARVHGPMVELLAELAPSFGDGKIYRPYRDVRFSTDKSPYKTTISASLASGGYIQLSAEGLMAGTGMWHMAPDQLERYRAAVDADSSGGELAQIVAAAARHGIEAGGHETLKTAPRGYAKDHPRIDLLRNKGLVVWKQWPVARWLGTAATKDRLIEFLELSKPVAGWLAGFVGPSELEPRER